MKKIFLSLLLGFVGLIGFGYCTTVEDLITYISSADDVSILSNSKTVIYNVSNSSDLGTYCVKINSFSNVTHIDLGYSKNLVSFDNGTQYYSIWEGDLPNLTCFYVFYGGIMLGNDQSISVDNISYEIFRLDDLLAENLPVMSSSECQSEYSLIPIEDIDTNYCVENDLCPVPGNFSQLFINDLEFPGKPLINVSIPDYIHWDYFSNDTGFDLYVGSGYDQDYIDSVLKINSYRPDSSDFTNIFVSGLTLLFPYLIFALFLVFMRKLIKRIFKH